MEEKQTFNIKQYSIEIIGTLIGAFFMAVGVSLFLLPNQLSSGGIAGIATITYYLFKFPMGTVIILINIPLFLLCAYKIGKKFLVKSIIGTIAISVFIDILDKFPPVTEDRFLACIYGGIIIGIGTAIILKANSSTGGTDLISYITREYKPSVKMGTIIVVIDTIIVALNVILLKEIEIGLYSAIAIYLSGKIIDILFEGIYFTKLLFIITDKSEEIAKEIGEKYERGTTGLYGKGMYKQEDKLILMCAASRGNITRIKMLVQKIDPNSFVIVTNAREVLGLGFKRIKT